MDFNFRQTDINLNNRMICVIEDEIIYEMNTAGQTQVIGHTEKWCNELVEVAQEYKQLCIDNGLIEEEKTPEQIQIELMQQMMAEIQKLSNKVEVLENGHNELSGTRSKPTGSGQNKGKGSGETSSTSVTESKE